MWEFFIVVNYEDSRYLRYLELQLDKLNFKVITAISSNSMSVACKYSLKNKLLNFLKPLLAEVILLIYKNKFYSENINIVLDSELKEAIVKVLTVFNFETEKEFVSNKLADLCSVNIPSFYSFMLKDLMVKWDSVAKLINSKNLFQSKTILDVLKLLLSFETGNKPVIDVYFNGKQFVLTDEFNNVIELIFSDDKEIKLLVELISLNPQKINLHCVTVLSNDVFKILHYIFNKKVNLLV